MAIKAHALKGNGRKAYFSGLGKSLNLKFNLNALYFLEQQYGDINKALGEIQGGQIKSLISITTAAINAGQNRKEAYTEDEVADFIGVDDLEGLSDALTDLLGKEDKNATPS